MRAHIRKFHIVTMLAVAVLLLNLGTSNSQKTNSQYSGEFTINLKSRALVIGPIITLGDIGSITIPDSIKKARLVELKIADAPPPGESSEISLNYVKKRLLAEGLKDAVLFLKGPSIIRVTTAQVEIDKAFVKEQFASLCNGGGCYWVDITDDV